VVDLGEGPGEHVPPFNLGKKREEITEGRKAGRASKTTPHPSPPLSSRSGSTTDNPLQR